jgi:ectoine hydroxylase-related dioxygenase (phytanoyl-CoA dioxygenase family)
MMTKNYAKHLAIHGYVVIRNFLSQYEIQEFITDAANTRVPAADQGLIYNENWLGEKNVSAVLHKLEVLMQLARLSNIQVDVLSNLLPLYIERRPDHVDEWHQDAQPWWQFQNSTNSLNIWIPLIKASSAHSGVEVISWHDLDSRLSPAVLKDIKGRGALTFDTVDHRTQVFDRTDESTWELDVDLDQLAIPLDMAAGDVLLMRDDLIHRTQQPTEKRLAFKLRCLNSQGQLTKDTFANVVCHKPMFYSQSQHRILHQSMQKLFLTQDTVSVNEVLRMTDCLIQQEINNNL